MPAHFQDARTLKVNTYTYQFGICNICRENKCIRILVGKHRVRDWWRGCDKEISVIVKEIENNFM